MTIDVEINELTPTTMVVEVKKRAADEEYKEFYSKELKPEM